MDFFTVPTITFHVLYLLLFPHQPRPSAHLALQCLSLSHQHLDCAAATRAFGEVLASSGYSLCDFLKSRSFPCRPAGRIVVLNYRSGMGVCCMENQHGSVEATGVKPVQMACQGQHRRVRAFEFLLQELEHVHKADREYQLQRSFYCHSPTNERLVLE
jgi:hypothetical protein